MTGLLTRACQPNSHSARRQHSNARFSEHRSRDSFAKPIPSVRAQHHYKRGVARSTASTSLLSFAPPTPAPTRRPPRGQGERNSAQTGRHQYSTTATSSSKGESTHVFLLRNSSPAFPSTPGVTRGCTEQKIPHQLNVPAAFRNFHSIQYAVYFVTDFHSIAVTSHVLDAGVLVVPEASHLDYLNSVLADGGHLALSSQEP